MNTDTIIIIGHGSFSDVYDEQLHELYYDPMKGKIEIKHDGRSSEFIAKEVGLRYQDLGYYVPGPFMFGSFPIGSRIEIQIKSDDYEYKFVPREWDVDIKNMYILTYLLNRDRFDASSVFKNNFWLGKSKYNLLTISLEIISLFTVFFLFIFTIVDVFFRVLLIISFLVGYYGIIVNQISKYLNFYGLSKIDERNKFLIDIIN